MSTEGYNLGPAPNWYCTRICDCNASGLLAYGARNYIVTVDVHVQPPVYKHFQIGHRERVTSVVFNRGKHANLLATGAEDGSVKIWDVDTWTTVQEHTGLQKISCLEWQNDSAVFVAEEVGVILLWEFKKKFTTSMKHGVRDKVFVLSSNPCNSTQLAVGFKGGLVAILDASRNGQILYKLKGHDEDVLSLSWKTPLDDSDVAWQLASTSRDRTLRVWNVQEEKCCIVFQIPHSQRLSKDDARNRYWAVASWAPASRAELILTTFFGELLRVTLVPDRKPKTETFDAKGIGGHTRCIFNISIFRDFAFTVSLDRTIVIWNLNQRKSTYVLPTLGGFAYSLAFSGIDVGRLAVGVGDNTIRVWNVSSATSPYSSTTLWQGIKGKVICLSWHPEKENWLGYGTDDGRVGIADAIGNKPPIVSSTYHRDTVYSLSWGPCKHFDDKTKWFLYSCGDGNVLIHNPSKHQSDALVLSKLLPSSRTKENCRWTELVWKPDWTVLALGCEDGTVQIFTPDYVLLACLMAQNKLIQCLCWHPGCTTSSSQVSDFNTWLACASNELVIHVYDLKEILENVLQDAEEPRIIMQSCRQLNVHRLRVTSLSWSPHQEGRLVSSSYDASVQVWDVITGMPIANYRGHQGRVFSVEWSLLDPDIVFSASEDFSVQQFCVSKVPNRFPIPAKKEKRNRKKKCEASFANVSQETTDQSFLSQELEELLLQKKNELQNAPSITSSEETFATNASDAIESSLAMEIGNIDIGQAIYAVLDTNSVGDIAEVKDVTSKENSVVDSQQKQSKPANRKKRKTVKSMFPLVSSLDNRGKTYSLDQCRYLVDRTELEGDTNSSEHHNLGFFTNRTPLLEMLDREATHHREEDNLDYALQMKVWTGDIGEALREADEKGQLDDWLVSLAPLASRTLWLEMCEKYSRQLASEGMYHKAALYLIACHKIYEAMDLLKENGFYREAVAIAKVRLPDSDPMLQRLMLDWASKVDKEGNYDMAAKCYLSLSRYSQAAKTLAKRNSPESYRMAAYIMAKAGKAVECEGYVLSCVRSALIRNDWDTVEKMVEEQIGLNVVVDVCALHLLISLHNRLTTILEDSKQILKPMPLHQILVQKRAFDVHLWKGYFSDDLHSFFDIVNEEWITKKFLPPNADFELRQDYYRFLSKLDACKQQAVTLKEMIYQLALHVTLEKLKLSFKLSEVLDTALKLNLGLFHDICRIVFPLDHIWNKKDSMPSATVAENSNQAVKLYETYSGVTVPQWLNHLLSEQNRVAIRDLRVEETTQKMEMSPLHAFYSLALLKNLKDELEDFEVVTHSFENAVTSTCSLPNCEDLQETLIFLLIIIASHLLNPSFDEEFCLTHATISDISSSTVEATLAKSDSNENDSDMEKLEGCNEICKETNNLSFPNPANSALKCFELCEELLVRVKCNLIAAKIQPFMEAIHKFMKKKQN